MDDPVFEVKFVGVDANVDHDRIEKLLLERQLQRKKGNYRAADEIRKQVCTGLVLVASHMTPASTAEGDASAGVNLHVEDVAGGSIVYSESRWKEEMKKKKEDKAVTSKRRQRVKAIKNRVIKRQHTDTDGTSEVGGVDISQVSEETVDSVKRVRALRNEKLRKHQTRQKKRAKAFGDWLVHTFSDVLSPSDKKLILDVAGGNGALSYHLVTDHSDVIRRVVVVDPQPVKLSSGKTNELLTASAWNSIEAAGSQESFGDELHMPSSSNNVVLRPQPSWLCPKAALRKSSTSSEPVNADLTSAARELSSRGVRQIRSLFDMETFLQQGSQSRAVFDGAQIVTGLHPDQATDPIVNAAMLHNKSFAVVPCCVFPNTFPRTLKDGTQVRTREQLCQFLCEKHPSIKMATIADMPGPCNDVIYCVRW